MCGEQHNDIPVRTLVVRDGDDWMARCLDFDLAARAAQVDEAVERLEEEIEQHLREAKAGRRPLFRPVGAEVWQQFYQAAEALLTTAGPGHAHIEHRPLVVEAVASPLAR
jgi:hypothetical protein